MILIGYGFGYSQFRITTHSQGIRRGDVEAYYGFTQLPGFPPTMNGPTCMNLNIDVYGFCDVPSYRRGGCTPPQLLQPTRGIYPPVLKLVAAAAAGRGHPPRPGERAATAAGGYTPPKFCINRCVMPRVCV